MNRLLNKIKKIEKTLKKGQSIIRFIEVTDKGYIISQSSKQAEIGMKLKDLNSIGSLSDLNSITFIEEIKE